MLVGAIAGATFYRGKTKQRDLGRMADMLLHNIPLTPTERHVLKSLVLPPSLPNRGTQWSWPFTRKWSAQICWTLEACRQHVLPFVTASPAYKQLYTTFLLFPLNTMCSGLWFYHLLYTTEVLNGAGHLDAHWPTQICEPQKLASTEAFFKYISL